MFLEKNKNDKKSTKEKKKKMPLILMNVLFGLKSYKLKIYTILLTLIIIC